jgi:hypothetical protein
LNDLVVVSLQWYTLFGIHLANVIEGCFDVGRTEVIFDGYDVHAVEVQLFGMDVGH